MNVYFSGYSDDIVAIWAESHDYETYPAVIDRSRGVELCEVAKVLGPEGKVAGTVLAMYDGAWSFMLKAKYVAKLDAIENLHFSVRGADCNEPHYTVDYSQVGMLELPEKFSVVFTDGEEKVSIKN